MADERWTAGTRELVEQVFDHVEFDLTDEVLTALADAGLLATPGTTGDAEAWRHNAKLHNDMRRRIARVMTHAAAEQRTLSWVADELADILDDPRAWCGETTVDTEETP